jgi:hypothetical protein
MQSSPADTRRDDTAAVLESRLAAAHAAVGRRCRNKYNQREAAGLSAIVPVPDRLMAPEPIPVCWPQAWMDSVRRASGCAWALDGAMPGDDKNPRTSCAPNVLDDLAPLR